MIKYCPKCLRSYPNHVRSCPVCSRDEITFLQEKPDPSPGFGKLLPETLLDSYKYKPPDT